MMQGGSSGLSRQDKVDLDTFLRMSDVASALKEQREEVDKQLNFDETKRDLRARLLKTAEITGEKLGEAEVNAAIEHYFEGLYSFKEPKKDFGYRLASLYVERARLFWRRVVPAIGLGAFVAGVFGAGKTIQYAHRKALEGDVEVVVQEAYQEREMLGEKVAEISNSSVKAELPESEKNKLSEIADNSNRRLNETDAFFLEFCSGGTASDDITQGNYKEAESQLVGIRSSLESIQSDVKIGERIIQAQVQVGSVRKGLDALIGEIKNLKPLPVFLQRAEGAYQNGIVCLNSRQVEKAADYQQELQGIKGDINVFSDLKTKTEKTYEDIKSVAREDKARGAGEQLYEQATRLIESADVPRLKPVVEQLEQLDGMLNQEYTIKIVSKPGVKSGIDRYYEGKFSGWYLVVEAINSNGRAIPLNITNCETGRTETVTMWGEKVDGNDPNIVEKIQRGVYNQNSLLQRVIKDKLDDGVVNKNIAGKKEKGYLEYELNDRDFLGKQITHW